MRKLLPQTAVSVLYREPKLLKAGFVIGKELALFVVSVLYREPKLLKDRMPFPKSLPRPGFSALP